MKVNHKIKVLFIAGSGRNGSTLLARILGQIQGFQSIGEATQYLYNEKMIAQNIPCSCGLPIPDCEFWNEIIPNITLEYIRPIATNQLRMRNIPIILSPIQLKGYKEKNKKLVNSFTSLFETINLATNCEVIVDASKNPTIALLHSQIPNIDLTIIHLVRDPRGFVSSWSKPKEYLKKVSTVRASSWWLYYNAFSEILRFHSKKYMLIRYEDFVNNTKECVEKITSLVSESESSTDFIRENQVRLTTQHLLGSNPNKYLIGDVTIKAQKWELPLYDELIVSILTLPFLIKYHYFPNCLNT